MKRSVGLLKPIYDAQFASIRASRVKAMDQTPVKAGRRERGKMRTAYFWPVYGEARTMDFLKRNEQSRAPLTYRVGAPDAVDGYCFDYSPASKCRSKSSVVGLARA